MTRTRPRRYTVPELRRRCQELRALVRAPRSPLATEEEVRAAWPGGENNGDRGLDGWIECYAQLAAFHARAEVREMRKADASEQLESVVRAAAARSPIPVTLSIGERAVYPKSAWALAFLDALDAVIEPLAGLASEIGQSLQGETASDASLDTLRGMPALAQGMAWRTWAWVLLSEGVELPFPDEGVISPPEYTAQLLPEDFVRIWAAHRTLHYESTAIMALAMPSEPGEPSRLSLSGFLAGYASEKGLAPSTLMRRWSFPEALAAAVSAYESHRVAEANAKRKRPEGGA